MPEAAGSMEMARVGSFPGTSQETLDVIAAISTPTNRRYVGLFVEVVIAVSLSSRMRKSHWSCSGGHVRSELVIRGLGHSIRFKLCAATDEGEQSLHRGQGRSRMLALTVIWN